MAAGWGVFAAIVWYVPVPIGEEMVGVALGAGGYVGLAVIAGTLPLAVLAHGLARYLRVERDPSNHDDDLAPSGSEPAFVFRIHDRH